MSTCEEGVKQGVKGIGRSSFVAGKWGDVFFGSFPVKLPGDRDTENICLNPLYVLHKGEREPESMCVFREKDKEEDVSAAAGGITQAAR